MYIQAVPENRVLILLDNFRVGGLERLALDQLFILSDLGIPAMAYYRDARITSRHPNFLTLEAERISRKNLVIRALPEGDWAQLKVIIQLMKNNNFSVIINHSVGASVILRAAKIVARNKVTIKTFIHQLPTLSAPVQRLKRFIYALASDEIYGYSNAVVKDWNKRLNSNLLSKFILGWKRPMVQRNGIYLERLPKAPVQKEHYQKQIRMVFIGRGVAWKNKEFIISALRKLRSNNTRALLVLPHIEPEYQKALEIEFGDRVEFEIGKKIEDITFTQNDVNVYPVNYGLGAKFIESVSLNCLEMACIGIPSIITKGGADTWPELIKIGIIYEMDWRQFSEFDTALNISANINFDLEQIEEIKSIVSIINNIRSITVNS